MGRDLTLYPKSASKRDLTKYLQSLGFKKCDHLWEWPTGTLNFHWYDPVDFRSITGVEADVYPASAEELNITGNSWAIHVRNTYSASWDDVNMLNEVLRQARKKFGGTIQGDYGTNRYAPLWRDDSTPISRGLSAAYEKVSDAISAVRYSLPDPAFSQPKLTDPKFAEFMGQMDPARVLYNGLVPFAVSMFEFFFAEAFEVLIAYDNDAQKKKKEYKQKVDFSVLVEITEKQRSVESVIASNYTFQNLNQLNKAYKDWLDIDVRKILFKKKRVGKSISFLENKIADIIKYRHGVVHGFEIDQNLDKEKYQDILTAIEKAIDEFLIHVEKKYKIKVNRN